MEDETIQKSMATQDQDVEDVEEELKTSGSFNMKKFREKLKTNDFITGKWDGCCFMANLIFFRLKNCVTFFKKLHPIPV